MAIPKVTGYAGVIPDRRTQSAEEFTSAAVTWTDYQAETLVPSTNAAINGMNAAQDEILASVNNAEESSFIAQAAANYQGPWFSGASVVKGESWSHNGLMWAANVTGAGEPQENAQWFLLKSEPELSAIKVMLEQWGYRYAGLFDDGFTYSQIGDAGVDNNNDAWVYVGVGAPNKTVSAGTVPSIGAGYEQVTFNYLQQLIGLDKPSNLDSRYKLKFPSVTKMKSSNPSLSSIIDDNDLLAETISYHTGWAALNKPEGGSGYVLTTVQRVRDSKSDPSWLPDGFGDHYLFNGTVYVAVLNQADLFAEMFGLSQHGTPEKNRESMEAAVEYIDENARGVLNVGAGRFLTNQINILNRSIYLVGANRSETLFINESSGNVFTLTTNDADGFKRSLRVKSIGLGRPITDGVHTSSGSHAIYSSGYNDITFEDVQINQSGGSGIKVRRSYVISWVGVRGGHAGQNADLRDGTLGVLDFKRDGGSGNSVRLNRCYLSNSSNTDALNIDYAQSVSIQDTTMESCQRLIKVGTVGFATRNVSIGGNSYFENPIICCGEFTNIYGLDLLGAYTNLTGTRSPSVEAVFKFELVDRVKIRGGSLSAPPDDVGNTKYKGALEFKTFGSLSVPGMMDIEASTSINEICINSSAEGRQTYNIRENRAGLRIKSIDNLWKPHTNLLTNTDLTTWSNAGGLPITTGEFYDGEPFYEADGDGSNTINTSVTTAVSSGDPLSFGVWAQGKVRLQIRGRRVSDNGFETVATLDSISSDTGSNEGSDIARRIYANGKALSDYNLINVIIRPSDIASIAYAQLNESLTPTDYK